MGRGSGESSYPLPNEEKHKVTAEDPELELAQATCDDLLAGEGKWQALRAVANAQGIDTVHVAIRRGGETVNKISIDCHPVRQRTVKTGSARRLPDGTIAFEMQEVSRGA
jgi:hypothetical protein